MIDVETIFDSDREEYEFMQQKKEQPMKEQIEEMRKDLIEIFDEEYEKRRMITPDFTVEKMTAKGYRKQKEGKWIVSGMFNDFLKCSSCGYQQPWQTAIEYKYCADCGAKMKCGAE